MPGQPGAVPVQATSSVDAFSHVGAPYASAPLPPKQPDPQFESLFRQPEGVVNPHSHTKLLPPVQGGGLPRTAAFQPGPVIPQQNPGSTEEWPRYGGGDEARRHHRASGTYDGEDPPVNRRMLVWGAVGALAVVVAVILGLLYLGSKSDPAADAAGPSGAPSISANSAPASPGSISLPTGTLPSTTPPSTTASTASAAAGNGDQLPLQPGSSGQLVQYVQQRLRQLGFYQGQVDGQYDQNTAQAVIQFQAHANVTGDAAGTVGRATLTALISAGSKPGLRPGSHDGADIRRLQQALNEAENAGLPVNGRYDAQTATAVAQYQQAAGLAPSGQVGDGVWGKLQSGFIVS